MMIRRNAKILVLGAALMLALPAVSSAQMSRVEGMAIQGDFIKDWSGIFTYTSQVANVGNLVYGELGNVNFPPVTFDRSVGAVIGNLWEGRLGTWAVHMREQSPNLGQGDASGSSGTDSLGGDPNTNTSESFDIMWGKKFGTTSFGLRVNRSNGRFLQQVGTSTTKTEADFTETDPNLSRNIVGVGGGIGFEMSPTSNVELGVLWQNRTWTEDTPGLRAEDKGASAYLFSGRAMWQWQPSIMVVPVVKYWKVDLGQQSTPTGGGATGLDEDFKGWQVGAAGNWTLGSNDLFVLGVNVAQNKHTEQVGTPGQDVEATQTFYPQMFGALETHVNSWLTLRFGANKGVVQKLEVVQPNGDKTERNFQSFNMRLGAGVKVGNLQLDAILADDFPNNLPYFISGNQTSDMFTKVTATYPF